MKYQLVDSKLKELQKEEVKYRKAPLFKRFLGQMLLYIIVMLLGLLVGYIAYVRSGIYSPKNLLCFMVGVALFSMGFQTLFSRIGSYVDNSSMIKSIDWNIEYQLDILSVQDYTVEESENGYIVTVKDILENIKVFNIVPDNISNIRVNCEKTQMCISLKNTKNSIRIADDLFSATMDNGQIANLKVLDIMKKLYELGVKCIYIYTDMKSLNSGLPKKMSNMHEWTPDEEPKVDVSNDAQSKDETPDVITESKAETVEASESQDTLKEEQESEVQEVNANDSNEGTAENDSVTDSTPVEVVKDTVEATDDVK